MTTRLDKRTKYFTDCGITEANIPVFLRSLGFYAPPESLTNTQWLEAMEELSAIAEEGLLHEYINYLKLDEGVHEIQGDEC